jgi:hypothetical protein
MTLEEMARETLMEKHRRLMKERCLHDEVYSSSVTGPAGSHTVSFCLDCGKRMEEDVSRETL